MISENNVNSIINAIENDDTYKKFCENVLTYEGSELGHTYGHRFEDIVCDVIDNVFGDVSEYDLDEKGNKKKRGFGDVYFIDNKVRNPINCKFGDETFGMPNVSSMNRHLKHYIEEENIDAYYMLKAKIKNGKVELIMFDLYDYIEFLGYDGGTGQIMLKEGNFYDCYGVCDKEYQTLDDKKIALLKLYDERMREHIRLKRQKHVVKMKSLLRKLKHLIIESSQNG